MKGSVTITHLFLSFKPDPQWPTVYSTSQQVTHWCVETDKALSHLELGVHVYNRVESESRAGGQMKNCGKYFPTFLELDSYQTIKPGCEVINSNDQLVVHLWKPVSTSVTVLFCSQSNSRAQSQLRLRKKAVVRQLLSLHTNLLIVFGNSNTGWPWKRPLSSLSVQVWGHVHREAAKLQTLAPFFLVGSSWGLWLEAHRVKMKHFWEEGLSQALPKVHKLLKITDRFIVFIWKPSVTGGIMFTNHTGLCVSSVTFIHWYVLLHESTWSEYS